MPCFTAFLSFFDKIKHITTQKIGTAMVSYIMESIESIISSFSLYSSIGSFSPYVFGATATGLGLFLGSLYTENESMLEFQKHVDKESYFQEMKNLFLRREQFSQALLFVSAAVIFTLLLEVGSFFVINSKMKKSNNFWGLAQSDICDRLERMEEVIESILRDNSNMDMKQMRIFKSEIDQQRDSFKNLITNKSLELETRISDAKTSCQKIKIAVHTDMQKVVEVSSKLMSMKNDFANIGESVKNTRVMTQSIQTEVAAALEEAREKIKHYMDEFESSCSSLEERSKLHEVDIFKCNAMLVNAEILLEAALAKFEFIEAIDTSDNSVKSESSRLVTCLQNALDVKKYFDDQPEVAQEDGEALNDALPFRTPAVEKNPYKNSVNSVIFELMKRLSLLEERTTDQMSMISKNADKIKLLDTSTTEKLSGMKFHSDEWITAWVSVIYSLFNSSFLQLENQLFGIDCLEYPTIFDVANEKLEENSTLFYDIMDKCKEKCVKIVKEVNLLIFEYYLVQNAYSGTNSSLLSMCNTKIDEEISDLFIHFDSTIRNSSISQSKQSGIMNTLLRLKMDLTSDLKSDTLRFNTLVKQNLDDFYLIHDTMKSIYKGSEIHITSSLRSHRDDNADDSIIEISDISNSLLSVHEDSSFSENEHSFSADSFSETSLKPFKLKGSTKRKEKNRINV